MTGNEYLEEAIYLLKNNLTKKGGFMITESEFKNRIDNLVSKEVDRVLRAGLIEFQHNRPKYGGMRWDDIVNLIKSKINEDTP